jgi:hypothetical protein
MEKSNPSFQRDGPETKIDNDMVIAFNFSRFLMKKPGCLMAEQQVRSDQINKKIKC